MTTPMTDSTRTARRSPLLFIVLGVVTIAAGIANAIGALNFPPNAPVEQITAFGITVDVFALLILVVTGIVVTRLPTPVRPASVLAIIGMCLTAIVLGIVIFVWVTGLLDLAQARLHYGDLTFTTFIFAPVWITGIAFSGFAYRRGGTALNNLFCVLGLVFGLLILALSAFAAVIYGMDLTT